MKRHSAVVGLQNGDEGKGKLIGYLTNEALQEVINQNGSADLVDPEVLDIRFQGGANAGHTVYTPNGIKFQLHQTPSGIVIPQIYALLDTGMYINPRKLMKELMELSVKGVAFDGRFGISSKAHVTLDYHVSDDQADFKLAEHECTGNGIKQTAGDKSLRLGLRFEEFMDPDIMFGILKSGPLKDSSDVDVQILVDSYMAERAFFEKYVVLSSDIINNPKFQFILSEGAQGAMIDQDYGQYPGSTSSNPIIVPHRPDEIWGVLKAYTSSVGIKNRPFVSEMDSALQDKVRTAWEEYGTSTGNPRHIGYFDTVAAGHAIANAHPDKLMLTCLDRLALLATLDEKIHIVGGYTIDGQTHYKWNRSFDNRETLKHAEPIYTISLDPWEQTVENNGEKLTPPAENYVKTIEEALGQHIDMVGVGPKHDDIVMR